MRNLLLSVILSATLFPVLAQQSGSYNQTALATLYETQSEKLEDIPEVTFKQVKLEGDSNLWAKNLFWNEIGRENLTLLQLINRDKLGNLGIDDLVYVPDKFGLDIRAYAPFQRYYPGAEQIDKLFIIDKSFQVFGAYEFGKLVRWGIISTGAPHLSLTPNGRYNFNWRDEFRISSESPPGEEWRLHWVVNFHLGRGIHTHQYNIPMRGPASHGCVRLTMSDSKWVYDWADTWERVRGTVVKQGSMVLVIGKEPSNGVPPFFNPEEPEHMRLVELPEDPWTVKAGTEQQRSFDRRRARQSRTSNTTK